MFNPTSPMVPAGHPPLFPPGPPSALTTKFLNMIPRTLSGAASPPLPGPHRPVTAEQQAKAMISSHEESEAASWPSPREAAQCLRPSVLPVPTIRIKGLTVMDRSESIVEAAEDCGRIHSERSKALYTLLVAGALGQHVALRPTVRVTPNRMTFFLVVDELPVLLGVCRATIYRAFDDLAKAGLVARRPWFTSSRMGNGGTVTGGVVVDVVPSPAQGTEARVRAEYLRQQYRNLDADRHAGRTAWQWMTEVKEAETQARALEAEAEVLPLDATNLRQIDALRARAADLRQDRKSVV